MGIFPVIIALEILTLAEAGGPCGLPIMEAWIDPIRGDDATGQFGVVSGMLSCGGAAPQSKPFKTISAASIAAQSFSPAPTLMHALPGIYSAASGETFPIWLCDGMQLQGAGAKETVIRGTGHPSVGTPIGRGDDSVYWPTCPNGQFVAAEVLIRFAPVDSDEEPPSLDRVTLQGGDVQVYIEGEVPGLAIYETVSNCVFDMRHCGEDNLHGPTFGVLIPSIYIGEGGIDYAVKRPNILNNTFIMGWRRADGTVEVARDEAVGICDVNYPAPASCCCPICFADSNHTQRGVNAPSIQNNLIRTLPDYPRTPMIGVDDTDTQALDSFGSPQSTNAFDGAIPLESDITGRFCSAIVGVAPLPRIDLAYNDPAFVGEAIGDIRYSQGHPFWNIRDWRLLPTSPLVEQGASPSPLDDCTSLLMASNGTMYIAHKSLAESGGTRYGAFQFDCDGYGNARVRSSDPFVPYAEVDIGADEVDALAVAASYGNDSKSHDTPYAAGILAGDSERWYIVPRYDVALIVFVAVWSYPDPAPCIWLTGPQTSVPAQKSKFGFLYLWSIQQTVSLPVLYGAWTDPYFGVSHDFGVVRLPVSDATVGGAIYLTEQPALLLGNAAILGNVAAEIF